MKAWVMTVVLLIVCLSCKVSPKPIHYNVDQCHACKMNIADNRFGAELVTTKGKVYKYDAIECLVPEVIKTGEDQYAHILVTDFSNPETFLNAKQATYLISPQRPSPMGRNLSAYPSPSNSLSPDDVWYDWQELIKHFQK